MSDNVAIKTPIMAQNNEDTVEEEETVVTESEGFKSISVTTVSSSSTVSSLFCAIIGVLIAMLSPVHFSLALFMVISSH